MIGRAARYACYACGYAANPCSYVSYAVTRVCAPHMRARARARSFSFLCFLLWVSQWRNRVTHVTAGISGVTAGVTA